MACALNPEQVVDLYTDIYQELKVGMDNKSVPAFDIASYMKDLYDDMVDPSDSESVQKTMLYIQAVPDIYQKVALLPEIKEYILRTPKLKNSYMDIMQMSQDFEDLNTVSKFLTTAKVSKKYIEAAIKVSNMAKGRMKVINDMDMIIDEVLMWSAATGRRKPISA